MQSDSQSPAGATPHSALLLAPNTSKLSMLFKDVPDSSPVMNLQASVQVSPDFFPLESLVKNKIHGVLRLACLILHTDLPKSLTMYLRVCTHWLAAVVVSCRQINTFTFQLGAQTCLANHCTCVSNMFVADKIE